MLLKPIKKNELILVSSQNMNKLITFSNRAPYGQIVFMAGGAGSGKGFAVSNFLDSSSFKTRDVDKMKEQLGKLDKLGKISVDAWYKKYGDKLKTEPRKAGMLSEKEHIQKFVLNSCMRYILSILLLLLIISTLSTYLNFIDF